MAIEKINIWDISQKLSGNSVKLSQKMQNDAKKVLTNKRKIGLAIITIIDLMSFCSISLMSLFFPKQVAKRGEVLEIFNFSFKFSVFITMVATPFFGMFVPKFGVKNMFITAVIASRLATTLFGTLHYVQNIIIFTLLSFILRGIETLGACIYFIAGYALIFSTFPEDVGLIRSLMETMVEIGTTIGPAIGELFFTKGGFGIPFFLVGAFMIILAVMGNYVLDDIQETLKDQPSLYQFIKIPMVFLSCCVVISVSLTMSALDPTLGEYFTTNVNIMEIVESQDDFYSSTDI